MKSWFMKLDTETQQRFAAARATQITDDIWTKGAQDALRIAVFAGFDIKEIMLDCWRHGSRKAEKTNATTVFNSMQRQRG